MTQRGNEQGKQGGKRMLTRAVITAAIAALAAPALAQDAYVIGVTGALTGPVASTQAPAMEAMRIYAERVNAAGGINGKPVKVILQDDAAEPSKAAANAKKLITQDNVVLLINASLSSTYAPTVAEAKRAGVPLLFASGVCPKDVYPPADALQFCTTAYASNYDSRASLAFIKETAKQPVRIGFAAMAIPLSRGEMDFAESQAPALGMTVADKEVIPPPTPDYTPFATKLKDANANWVFSWAPWVTQVRTLEALRRLGWEGDYLAWSHLEAEGELARLKDGKFYVIGANALFQEDLPIHREIAAAAKAANASYPGNQMAEGWIAGMVIEAALKSAGWPTDAAKVRAALETVKVDTKGLRGGPIEWTRENHFRTRQYYRVYRWDPAKSAIVLAKDWQPYDVK
jgi:ABC-type branched-subunit amino acid transport system substrate-binding protein